MGLWDEDEVCTLVPLSCVRGGNTSLQRTDAIAELRYCYLANYQLTVMPSQLTTNCNT